MRGACAAETGAGRKAFEYGYDLLHLGDVLSLVFCNRWTDPMEALDYRVTLGNDGALLVSPDPFDGASIRFAVPARVIPDRPYTSDVDNLLNGGNGINRRTIAGLAYWFPHRGSVSSALLVDMENVTFSDFTTAQPTQQRLFVHGLIAF